MLPKFIISQTACLVNSMTLHLFSCSWFKFLLQREKKIHRAICCLLDCFTYSFRNYFNSNPLYSSHNTRKGKKETRNRINFRREDNCVCGSLQYVVTDPIRSRGNLLDHTQLLELVIFPHPKKLIESLKFKSLPWPPSYLNKFQITLAQTMKIKYQMTVI